MPRPASTDFTGSAVTEGGFKTAITSLNDWLGLLLGSVDTVVRLVRGAQSARPSATESGWLRWNTDTDAFDVSKGSVWHKLILSKIDGTWNYLVEVTSASILKLKTSNAEAKLGIQCASAGEAEFGVDADEVFCKSTGTKMVRIWINGTPVFKIDSAGNLTVIGNVSANGTV